MVLREGDTSTYYIISYYTDTNDLYYLDVGSPNRICFYWFSDQIWDMKIAQILVFSFSLLIWNSNFAYKKVLLVWS